jgi:mRNA-degrading endonuclease RelE of RelBE toxin-antitoxin system
MECRAGAEHEIRESTACAPAAESCYTPQLAQDPIDTDIKWARIGLMVKVTVTPDALREIGRLPLPIQQRILNVLARLHRWPAVSGAKPLRGTLAGHYRIRTGDYRVQFRLEGDNLIVEKAGHRDGFYEE